MKRSSSGVSRLSSRNSRLDAASDGLRYVDALVELLALALDLAGRAVDHALQRLARLGVERVEELVEVDRGGRRVLLDDALVGDLLGALRRQAEVDVAVGDAGERGLADGGEGAVAQRRVVLVDLHRDLGLAVVGEVDVGDLADGRAADLHEVALDELGGVLEAGLDRVAAAGPDSRRTATTTATTRTAAKAAARR